MNTKAVSSIPQLTCLGRARMGESGWVRLGPLPARRDLVDVMLPPNATLAGGALLPVVPFPSGVPPACCIAMMMQSMM